MHCCCGGRAEERSDRAPLTLRGWICLLMQVVHFEAKWKGVREQEKPV